MTKAIMIQGAGSNVGKSMLTAGLGRLAKRKGLNAVPFKPQNMSNNASVTVDGGEIGRAQALQAFACGVDPHTDMNPVLLKPESETGSQIIVHGKRVTTLKAREYSKFKKLLLNPVKESFLRLKSSADLVIVEGAGSPAEINLRKNDIANMGFARSVNCPVILVGDIDRGGVIAQIVGTKKILHPKDAALIKGFIINKFRGDKTLFDEGVNIIEDKTRWKSLGIMPYFKNAINFPAEDILDLKDSKKSGPLKIACLVLSRIANFDDLDPLNAENDINLVLIKEGQVLPGDCDLVIIPGTKSTIADLEFLKRQGWHTDLESHLRRGGKILGICGGYQILGNIISDPDQIESSIQNVSALGLLDVETTMTPSKTLTKSKGVHLGTQITFEGYEIHMGQTNGADCERPFSKINGQFEGATSKNGLVMGSYIHGMFSTDKFRHEFIRQVTGNNLSGDLHHSSLVDDTLNELADQLEYSLDTNALFKFAK